MAQTVKNIEKLPFQYRFLQKTRKNLFLTRKMSQMANLKHSLHSYIKMPIFTLENNFICFSGNLYRKIAKYFSLLNFWCFWFYCFDKAQFFFENIQLLVPSIFYHYLQQRISAIIVGKVLTFWFFVMFDICLFTFSQQTNENHETSQTNRRRNWKIANDKKWMVRYVAFLDFPF